MKIYFDSCCYSRWQDEQTQERIVAETVAIDSIIDACRAGGHMIIGSHVVESELSENTDTAARDADMGRYWETVDDCATPSAASFARARTFQSKGLDEKDSYHLAFAESKGVDVLITVDDDFEEISTNRKLSVVKVINPRTFLQEMANDYSR